MLRLLGLGLLLVLVACQRGATLPPNSGYWSDARFWASLGLEKPRAGQEVVIPAGSRVILDEDPPPLGGITVLGELEFARKDLSLRVGYLMVHGPGVLRIGSEAQPFTHRATITLTGVPSEADVHLGMGTKFLGAMMGGRLEIIGEDRVPWTRLAETAPAGSTQIRLAQPVDWRVGEQIVIASTALDPHQAEVRTIRAVDGTLVTLDAPLTYAHFGQLQSFEGRVLDERAEVGLLSRNIVIQGDENWMGGFGGHVMVMGSHPDRRETNPALRSQARIRGVEFRRLGQFNRIARYPFHWHYNGDSRGDYLENSSFHSNFQRGIVVHGTDNVRVRNNVLYSTVGHSIVTEDGSEQGNRFEGNLVVLTRAFPYLPDNDLQEAQNDHKAASFWIKGPSNAFVGNVAAGGEFTAFWFDNVGAVDPQRFEFRDNTVHSYLLGKAIGAPGNVGDLGAIWITGDRAAPRFHGPFVLERLTIYKTRAALWANPAGDPGGEVWLEVRDSVLADNSVATGSHGLRDSLVVGRSANPDAEGEVGRFGVQEYGGATLLRNVTFVNFPPGTSALATRNCFREGPSMEVEGIRLVNAQFVLCSGNSDLAIVDRDGSLGGQPSTLVSAAYGARAMYTQACTLHASANARVCPGVWNYLNLFLETDRFYRSYSGMAPDLVRTDGVRQNGSDVTNPPFYWTLIEGQTYTLDTDLAQWQYLRLRLYPKHKNHDGSPRGAVVVLPTSLQAFAVYRCALEGQRPGRQCEGKTLLQPLGSRLELEASVQPAYFYDQAGRIYLKLLANTNSSLLVER
ncbi:G8 domain-containing protein [Meiothermus sp. QL-1]|uniref:G8 domain-containing protein n=1 Tax=Meiothermus sp. QL-1 TaxID=2058095 RepID=UPI001314FFF4|nr:G8 domain-containing protein [Meiothermus sp. QL-1]